MKLGTSGRIAALAIMALFAWLMVEPALAQAPTPPTPNKGDTAWMLTATVLVLLMTIPGLALFYGGLVRTKNMLSMLMQVFYTVCAVCIIWVLYGYSMAFTEGSIYNSLFGSFSKAFLAGVTPESTVETFTQGVVIPEYVYICFQMTFACITPALIVGAMAERMKFSAIALFIPLWVTFVYFPMAHMVWYWAGPEAIAGAAKAIADAGADQAKKQAAEALLAAANANAGLAFQWGALDFAGGTVVHINSGIAALVGALVVGKRVGFGKEAMPPHSLTLTLVGGALLWVGWFGFNAGSALEAGGTASLAMLNTFVATAGAALAWLLAENISKGKPSLLGAVTGAVAGLVAVTPAAGFAGPMGAIVLGLVAGFVCFIACSAIKNALGYDDALDVFGVHGVGGIVGAIGTGILAAPFLGGSGVFDYTTGKIADYDMVTQVISQIKAVCLTIVWSGLGTLILLTVVRAVVGLRPAADQEREGLDLVDHGERAYNY
ncbi:MAG TPA: ammonium transporter [Hyphomicrobiaceae bacterium]|jgi:Amt family ammonium transporter|nr:ammonium transporter [Hyphomicrobiaceae bacterium]